MSVPFSAVAATCLLCSGRISISKLLPGKHARPDQARGRSPLRQPHLGPLPQPRQCALARLLDGAIEEKLVRARETTPDRHPLRLEDVHEARDARPEVSPQAVEELQGGGVAALRSLHGLAARDA